MSQDLITVVLPIYNVEKYLDRCMKSVVNQTYTNLEIIMVDDGATDGSGELCDSWAEKDSRVKVIHKKNEGLGMARNTGIENATGKYIAFFDSDDYIEPNTIEECYKRACEDSSELVIFGHSLVGKDNFVKLAVIPSSERLVYRDKEISSIVLKDLLVQGKSSPVIKNMWMSAWSFLYSMDLIKRANWHFVSERQIISEDVYSLLQLFSYVNSISIVDKSLYNYCENEGSLTRVFRKDRFDKINIFYNETMKEAERLEMSEEIKNNITYPYIANIIAMLKMLVDSDLEYAEKLKELNKVCENETLLKALSKIDISKENITRRILLKQILANNARMIMFFVKLKKMIKK